MNDLVRNAGDVVDEDNGNQNQGYDDYDLDRATRSIRPMKHQILYEQYKRITYSREWSKTKQNKTNKHFFLSYRFMLNAIKIHSGRSVGQRNIIIINFCFYGTCWICMNRFILLRPFCVSLSYSSGCLIPNYEHHFWLINFDSKDKVCKMNWITSVIKICVCVFLSSWTKF